MKITNQLIRATLLGAAMSCAMLAAPAQAQVNVTIDLAPPAPRYEAMPQLRHGYVWAPGYWAFQNRHYVWVPGRQILARPGQRWVADYYEPGNRYHAGHWERDDRHGYRRDSYDRHDRYERREEHEGRHNGHGESFCPPGQAKKGNC